MQSVVFALNTGQDQASEFIYFFAFFNLYVQL